MKALKWMILGSLILLAGCRSSLITSSWKAESSELKNYKKVLVLGLIRDNDRRLREKMEQHLAGDLRELGYTAITSLDEFGPQAFADMTEKEALSRLRTSEIEAVVTIVLLNKKMERDYVPAAMFQAPYYYRNRFWDYYGTMNSRIYEPGYYFTNTEYFWESNVYEMNKQGLVYSVQTQSFNPENAERLGHEYGVMIVKDMIKKNVITKQSSTIPKGF